VPQLRPVRSSDLDLICRHRQEMFRESGRPPAQVAAMAEPFREWLAPRLADGRYFGWIVEEGGAPVAGLGMMEIDWPPHPLHPREARRGYILNVYVEPGFRRRGLARLLMETAQEEARRRGIGYAILHATDQGRALYEALGWTDTAEMALSIGAPLA
jgi:ribosomal protein S18 acetylase RimI-like enzyme